MAFPQPLRQARFSSNLLLISLLVLLAASGLLWKLGTGSLAAWDEAIYAEVSKEVIATGNWLTLHWQYQPWFEKPPLFIWITALFFRIFGVSEFWARLPSALSGVALIVVTYLIGKLKYDARVSILAALVLMTSYHFLSFSRFGTMEVMLTLFTYVAVYGYLRVNVENQKWWYLVWSSCALALMVKGAGGVIAPAAIVLALIVDKRFGASIRSKHFWQAFLLAVLIVAPWHVLMYVWYGRAFIDEYIGYHVIARSTTTLEGNASGYFYYVGRLVDGFFPWCLLAPFGVVSTIRRKPESRFWMLLIVCALVFGIYTLIPTRRPWYIIPLYPALAILIAAFISNLYRKYESRSHYRRIVVAAFVVLIIVAGLYSIVSLDLNHKPEEPLAKLSGLARSTSTDDKDSLLLLAGVEPIYAQVALFYSNRPIQQVYVSSKPESEDARRYVNYENLADLNHGPTKRMILRKEDIPLLSRDYEIQVVAENDSLVYALIRRK
jgi:4-amino-4-deoxy-L-arabinose transferase-like glycosyltransferase